LYILEIVRLSVLFIKWFNNAPTRIVFFGGCLCLYPQVCNRKRDIKVGTPKSYEIISLKKSVSLDGQEDSSQVFFKTIKTFNKELLA
jgi:hypothetical protein